MKSLAAACLFVLAALPSASWAAPAKAEAEIESPKFASAGVSFGVMNFADETIADVYGKTPRFYPRISVGLVPWSRYVHVEVVGSVGFIQFEGAEQFLSGAGASADSAWLTVVPLQVDLLLGIDIATEQPVVPYGGVGLQVSLWREATNGGNGCGDSGVYCGNRYGGNAFFGAALLLDRLEPNRAHKVDATSGINDAYFTVEGRFADVSMKVENGAWSREGLRWGGWSMHFGIKLIL